MTADVERTVRASLVEVRFIKKLLHTCLGRAGATDFVTGRRHWSSNNHFDEELTQIKWTSTSPLKSSDNPAWRK
jgi:hypothetical protein